MFVILQVVCAIPGYMASLMINHCFYTIISCKSVGEAGGSCAIFCFQRPLDVLLCLQVSDLAQPKIYIFGHIMCEFWLHGTAVEITVGNGKTKMKWHNLPQPWGKLCHHVRQAVSTCHARKSSCKYS